MGSDNEKEERKKNIIIEGTDILGGRWKYMGKKGENGSKGLQKKDWRQNVVFSRINGTVIVIRIGSEEERSEIMRNKHKLKGGKIFIENDFELGGKENSGED